MMDDKNPYKIDPLWRLNELLTIKEAAALIAGIDPNYVRLGHSEDDAYVLDSHNTVSEYVDLNRFVTIFKAVKSAVLSTSLTIVYSYMSSRSKAGQLPDSVREHLTKGQDSGSATSRSDLIDWENSSIPTDELKKWLKSKGFNTGFFFENEEAATPYLDKSNPRYAPKLATAVSAWLAVTDPGPKTPKQAIEKWVREHASEFGLTNDDGLPSVSAVEEIAKVSNWNLGGGAPKTPGT